MSALQAFVGEFLTFLEKREERLLNWGFHNVRWSFAEAQNAFDTEAPLELKRLWSPLDVTGRTLRSVLQEMHRRQLLYLVPGSTDAYRTRFAEGVRLMANLRQRFDDKDWDTGPRLVSDIKLHLESRVYPRRDQSADQVWQQLSALCARGTEQFVRDCFYALAASPGGGSFSFAGFQMRAFKHIFEKYGAQEFGGSVVSAGTGSGKTKAFYIPAFLRIATELNQAPFTKIIAVYPRNVLLADQLREAITEAEKLRPVLESKNLRPIRFGALLGSTPHDWWFDLKRPERYHWKRVSDGTIVPFLTSPLIAHAGAALIWRDADRQNGRTCLYREGEVTPDVPDGVLALTRQQLMQDPPDVLFLSLEMLNREISSPGWQRTFGLRQGQRSPRLLLLDEVHAYEGLTGAQAAWVLRRWLFWANLNALHVVGLSATLQDAPQHLARVASLWPANVQEFRPAVGLAPDGEMECEGAEYHLALKGDPAAGSALLSTSIQAGMLLARLLTPRTQSSSSDQTRVRSDVFFRKKVFAFTDNLDSVNRWFNDMSDAEASPTLAALRRKTGLALPPSQTLRREQGGQIWELPEEIGHDLTRSLVVSRCSSQDPGANAGSDLIIATSSLEVGFDDPDVGAMLHHKRPRSIASFIQRKGRAGRTRGSRPWTVTVLSDYGADRWAFQSSEKLFLPEVTALLLPIANPFVLRVQAAFFLLDWIGQRIHGKDGVYRVLSGPLNDYENRQAQLRVADLLRRILDGGSPWKDFQRDFSRFLERFSGGTRENIKATIDDVLWHEPRPIITEVIPSLLRKLECNWERAYPSVHGAREDAGAKRPIPQFIPASTYDELEAGEAVLDLEAFGSQVRQSEMVPVNKLLFETCPGRVSKRFATALNERGYWHPWSYKLQAGHNSARVSELYSQSTQIDFVNGVCVYQPEQAAVVHRPLSVADSSSASWDWQVIGRSQGPSEPLPVYSEKPWRDVFSCAEVYLHSNSAWLDILRFTSSARFEKRELRQSVMGTVALESPTDEGGIQRQALGYRVRADGFRWLVSASHLLTCTAVPIQMLPRFRADYFAHCVRTAPALQDSVNAFRADWLSQMSIAMLTATALRQGCTLEDAQRLLVARGNAARAVLDVIFQIQGIRPTGDEAAARLKTALLDYWHDPMFVAEISRLEALLWSPLDIEFMRWTHQRHVATLAQTLRVALSSLSSQVSEDDLAVDIIPQESGDIEILITEHSAGGLGQVETIARQIQREPRRFLDAIEHTLRYCPREETTSNLLAVLEAGVDHNGSLPAAFNAVRQAEGFSEAEVARDALTSALQSEGFPTRRSLYVPIVTRILRPSSSEATDFLSRGINRAWRRESVRLGVALPARVFAYVCVQYAPLKRRLTGLFAQISGGDIPSDTQLYAQIQQLLFETCHDSCPECLHDPNPFSGLAKPSRALTRSSLSIEIAEVSADQADWINLARIALRRDGRVQIFCPESIREQISRQLPELVAHELDLETLRVPLSLAGVTTSAGVTRILIQVPHFVHD